MLSRPESGTETAGACARRSASAATREEQALADSRRFGEITEHEFLTEIRRLDPYRGILVAGALEFRKVKKEKRIEHGTGTGTGTSDSDGSDL